MVQEKKTIWYLSPPTLETKMFSSWFYQFYQSAKTRLKKCAPVKTGSVCFGTHLYLQIQREKLNVDKRKEALSKYYSTEKKVSTVNWSRYQINYNYSKAMRKYPLSLHGRFFKRWIKMHDILQFNLFQMQKRHNDALCSVLYKMATNTAESLVWSGSQFATILELVDITSILSHLITYNCTKRIKLRF